MFAPNTLLVLIALVAAGALGATVDFSAWEASRAHRASLDRALRYNDFGREFANGEDRIALKEQFEGLAGATQEATVLNLIDWINREIARDEVMSVRATEILRLRSAACEVHALAVGVLSSLGIRSRWISGARSSPGFGFLEAFVDGRWQLFKLRDPKHKRLGMSALELYRKSEPGLNVRNFYPRAGLSLQSWSGSVAVVLFPLANIEKYPEIEVLFQEERGLDTGFVESFSPRNVFYAWFDQADDQWIKNQSTRREFARQYNAWNARRTRIYDFGLLSLTLRLPLDPIPGGFELAVGFD